MWSGSALLHEDYPQVSPKAHCWVLFCSPSIPALSGRSYHPMGFHTTAMLRTLTSSCSSLSQTLVHTLPAQLSACLIMDCCSSAERKFQQDRADGFLRRILVSSRSCDLLGQPLDLTIWHCMQTWGNRGQSCPSCIIKLDWLRFLFTTLLGSNHKGQPGACCCEESCSNPERSCVTCL